MPDSLESLFKQLSTNFTGAAIVKLASRISSTLTLKKRFGGKNEITSDELTAITIDICKYPT